MLKYLSSFRTGSIARISTDNFPLANAKSNFPKISWLEINSSEISPTIADNSAKILSISSCSSSFNFLSSLFISTILIGSINNVAPDDDWSWTIPDIDDLYSAFTGITNLSPLIDIMLSCRYFWYVVELMIEFNFDLIDWFFWTILLLIVLSVVDALSDISDSPTIEVYILSSTSLYVYKAFVRDWIIG